MNECNWHLNELKKRNNLINHVHGHRKPKAEMKGDFYYGANNDNNEKITNWIAVFLSLHFGQRSRCIFPWFCTLYCLVKVKAISFSFSILAVRRFVSVFFLFLLKKFAVVIVAIRSLPLSQSPPPPRSPLPLHPSLRPPAPSLSLLLSPIVCCLLIFFTVSLCFIQTWLSMLLPFVYILLLFTLMAICFDSKTLLKLPVCECGLLFWSITFYYSCLFTLNWSVQKMSGCNDISGHGMYKVDSYNYKALNHFIISYNVCTYTVRGKKVQNEIALFLNLFVICCLNPIFRLYLSFLLLPYMCIYCEAK